MAATGSNLKYQWQYSTDGSKWNNTALTGYNTSKLQVGVSSTTNGRLYRCKITDGSGNSVTSNAAKLTMLSTLSITTQPINQSAASGYVYFTVVANGEGLKYRWQWSSDGKTWGDTSLTGYNTNRLRVGVSSTTHGRLYRCIVSDKYGNTVTSASAKLTQSKSLFITAQPEDQTASSGYVYFSITANGIGLSYQWQWSPDGSYWEDTFLQGYNSDSLRVDVSDAEDGSLYRCIVSDQNGNMAISDAAMLTKE